tara:strand:- start:1478 stop:1711 length:234 start_codon:yes stop_codon:yes gene_type:complete
MKNLYNMRQNQVGNVTEIDSRLNSKIRLAEMGVMQGVDIRLIKKTPMGGPVEIKINNYYLTLRKEDAMLIYLDILES